MERKKLFRPRQSVGPDDLDDMLDGIRETFDHIVTDAVSTERRFTGFQAAKESQTSVRLAPGRLYQEGRGYVAGTDSVISLTPHMPVQHARVIAVYVSGSVIQTDLDERSFVTDLSTVPPTGIAEQVPLTELRLAQASYTAGLPSVDPQMPVIPAGACVVATLVLAPAGIVDGSIVRALENGLPNLEDHERRLKELDAWRLAAGTKIDTLTSEQASLLARTVGKADAKDQYGIMVDLARIKKLLELPTAGAPYDSDNYRTSAKIDQTASPENSNYKLSRTFPSALFPNAQASSMLLTLFNLYDDRAIRSGTDLVLPKYKDVVAVEVPGFSGELNISQFSATTTVTKKFTGYKTETRYGY